ncbi:MAG TPA: cupin domain-containing protein [Rhizomicrobium sp.]
MISTLQELVESVGEGQFRDRLRTRALFFRRGADKARFDGLLDWTTLLGIIESGAMAPDRLRVTVKRRAVAPAFYAKDGKIDAANLAKLLDGDASLIAMRIDLHVPALAALCADIARRVPEEIYAGAIATTGRSGAFALHYDPQDLIILQVEGTKRWSIHGPPVDFPVEGMPQQVPPAGAPLFDETLAPGDLLFVPAGYWHYCENGPGRSLHIGIFIEPPKGCHAVKAILPGLLAEEIFRRPLTRFRDDAERAAYEAALKARLVEIVERMSLADAPAGKTGPEPHGE